MAMPQGQAKRGLAKAIPEIRSQDPRLTSPGSEEWIIHRLAQASQSRICGKRNS